MSRIIEADKIGSATSPLNLSRTIAVIDSNGAPRAGDVIVVRVLTDNATYNMLELPTGRLAKVNPGDVHRIRFTTSASRPLKQTPFTTSATPKALSS